MNIKKLNEEINRSLNEELSTEILLGFLKESVDHAKAKLDKCYNRAQYRFLENVSYNPEQIRDMVYKFTQQINDGVDSIYDLIYGELG